MIFESWPWRQDLLKDADVLRRWKDKPISARRDFIIEKKVFTSAYVMRKLVESLKISSDQSGYNVRCRIHRSVKPITWYDRWEYFDHYDMANPNDAHIAASALFNLIIHSFIFVESVEEDRQCLLGFFVTSDRRRNEALWGIDMEDYMNLMRRIAADNPTNIQMRYDKAKGEWVHWRGHGEPPPEFRIRPADGGSSRVRS